MLRFVVLSIILLALLSDSGYSQTLQSGASDQGTPVIINARRVWEDITSVTLPALDGANAVMVVANFETRIASGDRDMIGEFRITDNTTSSEEISRLVIGKTYLDKGLGAANHIFSYTGYTGSRTFTLQHKQIGGGRGRYIASKGNMVAIVLDNSTVGLPYDIQTTGNVATSSTAYTQIPASVTGAITLPHAAGIYLTAAFSMRGDVDLTGEWVLRSSTDGTNFTPISNTAISRSVPPKVGAASIATILENQPPGTYYFDVAQRTSTGTLTTMNLTLIAVGLSEANGNVYPSYNSSGGSASTSSSTPSTAATTGTISSVADSNRLFAHAVFNMSAGSVIDASGFSLGISNATFSPVTLNRYITAGGTGSGGLVGLATGLSSESTHQVSLYHSSDGSNSLTTSNIQIVGFQLNSKPLEWGGSVSGDWHTASNWSPEVVPGIANSISITSGSAVIAANGSAWCNNLAVDGGGGLSINSDASSSGSLIIAGRSSGNITYNRYLSGTLWHVIAAPVAGQDLWDYATDPGNSVAEKDSKRAITSYNEGTDGWNPYPTTDPSESFIKGRGYSTLRTANGTVSFTGTAVTDDVTDTPLSRNSQGWNLLGNPYTSAINATVTADPVNNLLTVNSASLDPSFAAIYLWDAASSTYLTISNAIGGTLSEHHIQAGQGFFMRAIEGGGSVDITRTMQSSQNGVPFLKSSNKPWPTIKLTASGDESTCNTFISFNSAMTRGLDITYDAGIYRGGGEVSIYTRLAEDNGVDFAIQSLPTNEEDLIIPLGIEAPDGMEITLRAEIESWPEHGSLYLEDRGAGTSTRIDSAEFEYSFFADSLKQGIGNFFLHSNVITIGIEKEVESSDPFKIVVHRSGGYVRIIGNVNPGARIRVYDLSGRMLANASLLNGNENILYLSDLNGGIYLLLIEDGNEITGKKILW
ncbi:MAG: T9SS type A sorting domain-containing protein [Bacteroidota bacterium]